MVFLFRQPVACPNRPHDIRMKCHRVWEHLSQVFSNLDNSAVVRTVVVRSTMVVESCDNSDRSASQAQCAILRINLLVSFPSISFRILFLRSTNRHEWSSSVWFAICWRRRRRKDEKMRPARPSPGYLLEECIVQFLIVNVNLSHFRSGTFSHFCF